MPDIQPHHLSNRVSPPIISPPPLALPKIRPTFALPNRTDEGHKSRLKPQQGRKNRKFFLFPEKLSVPLHPASTGRNRIWKALPKNKPNFFSLNLCKSKKHRTFALPKGIEGFKTILNQPEPQATMSLQLEATHVLWMIGKDNLVRLTASNCSK